MIKTLQSGHIFDDVAGRGFARLLLVALLLVWPSLLRAEDAGAPADVEPADVHLAEAEPTRGTHWYSIPYAPQGPQATPFPLYRDPGAESPRAARTWYGWQTLIADGVALTAFLVGVAHERTEDATPYLVLGTLGWFLPAPIIHFAHDNGLEGFGSLGMRAVPALLIIVMLEDCPLGGSSGVNRDATCVLLGLMSVVGIPAAVAVDATLLAYEERTQVNASLQRAPTATGPTLGVSLRPWRDAHRDAWGLRLRAAF